MSDDFVYYSIVYHFFHINRPQEVIVVPVVIGNTIEFHARQQCCQIFHILNGGHVIIVAVIHIYTTGYLVDIIGWRCLLLVVLLIQFDAVIVLTEITGCVQLQVVNNLCCGSTSGMCFANVWQQCLHIEIII